MWERLQGARVGGLWCGGSPSGGLGASAGCRPGSPVDVGDCRSPGGATAAGGNSPVAPRQQPLHRAHGRRKGGCWRKSTRKPVGPPAWAEGAGRAAKAPKGLVNTIKGTDEWNPADQGAARRKTAFCNGGMMVVVCDHHVPFRMTVTDDDHHSQSLNDGCGL